VLRINSDELDAIPSAGLSVVHDLNADPRLPFPDRSFDAVMCCPSVDHLTRPIEVFTDVARVVRPGAPFVCAFSPIATEEKGSCNLGVLEISFSWPLRGG
jgi:ubiquinone/menaquinone biosynthesis C-methylase UbiE